MADRSYLYGGDAAGGGGSGYNSVTLTNKRMSSSSSPKPLDSFFISGSSHSFLGSRSMVSFEDKRNGSSSLCFGAVGQEDNYGDDEYDDYFHHPEKQRRLKADQVRFLESSFETENKLEPERKIQLAKELGLQPRQVAIWFQNRRARWKNKQLEKEYDLLQESYNQLKENYENLVQEKERLKSEVVDLSEKLLQQESEKGSSDSSSTKSPSEPLQEEQIVDFVNDDDEDVTRTLSNVDVKSVVSEASSLRYVERSGSLVVHGDSSYLFEHDQSDESIDEEDNLFGKMFVTPVSGYMLPKIEYGDYPELEAANFCQHGLLNEDQSFGFWSY